MLFLGLGTGLGSTVIVGDIVEPMEHGHLPYGEGTYEDYVGLRGLKRLGKSEWRERVADVVGQLVAALEPDDVVLGGGDVNLLDKLPPGCRAGDNANAIDLIDDDDVDPSGLHIDEQFLQSRPIHRAAGKAAIVITIPDQSPALVSLALDVGLGRLTLSVERIEVLLEPLVGRDARVDRTSQAPLGRQILHRGGLPSEASCAFLAPALASPFRRSLP